MSDISSILDATLDDIKDLPAFKTFPTGSHTVRINFEEKTVGAHPSVELKLTAIETLELANPSDIAPAAGDQTTILFMLDNEFGLGKLKEVLKPLGEHSGEKAIRAIIAAANGLECMVTTKMRSGKGDKADERYTDIVKLMVV